MAPQNNSTHAEIWDDSTLVNSWNEALEEYEKYHSIHARGEKVENVLNAFENQNNGLDEMMDEDGGEIVEEHVEKNIIEQDEFKKTEDRTPTETGPRVDGQPTGKAKESESQPPSSKAPTLPPQLIGQVHDENLKNLLMSWYYAGYYTGLYEGQQQKETNKST